MDSVDQRKFPRIRHITSRHIVTIDPLQTPKKNIVLTKNLSACGIRFTTNEPIPSSTYFLICLNAPMLTDLNQNKQNLLQCGDFYLSCVIWSQPIKSNLYDVGARFVEKRPVNSHELETFTELVNINMLDQLHHTPGSAVS